MGQLSVSTPNMNDTNRKDPIISNWKKLMQCNIDAVLTYLKNEIGYEPCIQNNGNYKHYKRLILFDLQERNYYTQLVTALIQTNQQIIVDALEQNQSSSTNINNNNNSDNINIKVRHSTNFYYQSEKDKNKVYSTKSKNRNHVLIINNIIFNDETKHPKRKGAEKDQTNLCELFGQIGGSTMEVHNNKTAKEMENICASFAKADDRKIADICFVIIMSHGNELYSDTIIYGVDGKEVKASCIQEYFNNSNSPDFKDKPKIFIYQACRNKKEDKTESDGEYHPTYFRTHDDMLTAHSTYSGETSIRDPKDGSWYIQCICKIFMEHCYNQPVTELMQLVDGAMKEYGSQTPQMNSVGFKKCYLHPGIYEEDNKMHKFHNN